MRQGQQNKRMRGRNRKGPNPLTRSYESNGPDVKIRGTAHHIAEKYLSLARDAQSSGDRVAAESYLQHAEHYFRIIAAAQQQFAQQSPQMATPDQPYVRGEDEDDDEPMQNDRFYSNIPPPPQFNQNNQNNGHPYRNGDSQPNYNGNHNRDQQNYNNGNGSDAPPRNEQPPRSESGGSYDEAGFGGEPPAFVGGQGNFGGGNEQNPSNQPGGQEGGNYRRRRRSGRDRQRFQDRGPDGAPPAGPANEGGGSDE